MTANRLQTYTRRTQRRSTVYAAWRKSFYCNMGLGRVELPTSRLSGPHNETIVASVRVCCARVPSARAFRRESGTAPKPTFARTQRVHGKPRSAR
jgi:hypothetical protein